MGAALTQHPELFRRGASRTSASTTCCASSSSPNGAFNVTEFGTVKDPTQFRALLRLLAVPPREGRHGVSGDAVHDRRERSARRPDAVAQDDRAAAGGDGSASRPILLRTSVDARATASAAPLDDKIDEATDVYAFLFEKLGVVYRPVK